MVDTSVDEIEGTLEGETVRTGVSVIKLMAGLTVGCQDGLKEVKSTGDDEGVLVGPKDSMNEGAFDGIGVLGRVDNLVGHIDGKFVRAVVGHMVLWATGNGVGKILGVRDGIAEGGTDKGNEVGAMGDMECSPVGIFVTRDEPEEVD